MAMRSRSGVIVAPDAMQSKVFAAKPSKMPLKFAPL